MNRIFPCAAIAVFVFSGLYAVDRSRAESPVVSLRSNDLTTIVAGKARKFGRLVGDSVVAGFRKPQDAVEWTVVAPKADDYAVSVIFSSPHRHTMEIACGDSVVTAPSVMRTWEGRPFYWRQEFPGVLHLEPGENRIRFRLLDPVSEVRGDPRKVSIVGLASEFALYSIELGTPAARKAQRERAKAIRGDTSWMIEGKYGLFVHWSALSYPFRGDKPRAEWFQESVAMFDVKTFADAVERTGAAWVTFTATHKGFYWPGPNEALDA
ncbi:MAG: hypothetical protein D6741_15240, partial [Planctomycetota bacterium]